MSGSNEPIAIIGSGCRFPGGCSTASKLWELLREPRDLLTRIPANRFSADGFYHPDGLYHGNSNVKDSYFLSENYRQFDAQFFEVKPIEANVIDPQHRLLLETVYECIESAGLTINGLKGSKTAVYVGLMCADYDSLLLRDTDSMPKYHATGVARSLISNRVSYFFDWHGPSMTIDTACSSSLVALHQAVQVLRIGDSRVAVAAGSNLILGPENYIGESKLKMLSPDSRSRMWDADANGYARGEGIAAVVMKTLSAALEDGDDIECIIRETGINQDGRTTGITMPSAVSQAALIRETYSKAGLDLTNKSDRCQYFEAHGTGTLAGDAIEAEAISSAFFDSSRPSGAELSGDLAATGRGNDRDILFVGSIKTVIGHTEGTAGLAAILKASLALQNGEIPPNLLFNRLNPAIKPFAENLEIPIKAKPWPAVIDGQPRRASVNSFGFGGTNAHAILESFEPAKDQVQSRNVFERNISETDKVFMPFVLSANCERSLALMVAAYVTKLKAGGFSSLRDLAWTLYARRSNLPVKVAVPAVSLESLCTKLAGKLETTKENADNRIGIRSTVFPVSARILGVFTGQGAQWVHMGRDLILQSGYVQKKIDDLDNDLAQLPACDRPSWSLRNALLADEPSSHVHEAALSQPLCTAIQIVLVDLLHSAGVHFKAIVGHSSGEIGAAYAAGLITSRDAIYISYYRGFHANLACSPESQRGAMLTVGTSFEDAQELCELPDFEGKIFVAAQNSSTSVVISGDLDAIKHAEIVFTDENKFVRRLVVDKAYHSHHMVPCADPYVKSLQACNIKVLYPDSSTYSWFSSVYVEELLDVHHTLKDFYWSDNMVKPVLFKQALKQAFAMKGPFDIAVEVGPHPVLKGPATQTLQDLSGGLTPIPYTGLLKRGVNDIEAVADALGYLWSHFRHPGVDLGAYDKLMNGDAKFQVPKNLPPYPWDHDRDFWQESRLSRAFRTRSQPTHELLGNKCPDGVAQQLQWRNILRFRELPWLEGHKLQEQVVFPAAGYIVLAFEASKALAGAEKVKLIEVQDLVIHQAMVFNDAESGVETKFTFSDVCRIFKDVIQATFMYYSGAGSEIDNLTLMASGKVEMSLSESMTAALPYRSPAEPNMIEIDNDLFYSSLAEIGYEYAGPFRALSSMKRKLGKSTGFITKPHCSHPQREFLVHPAMLDAAIQSVILAYCYPNDGRLWSVHVPTAIRRVIVNPSLCNTESLNGEVRFPFDAVLSGNDELALHGDVDVYSEDGRRALLQVEGIHCVPFTKASPADDLKLFSAVTWRTAVPNGGAVAWDGRATEDQCELALHLERLSYFYLRNLDKVIPQDHPARSEGPYKGLFGFAAHIYSLVSSGRHKYAKIEWENDTLKEILSPLEKYSGSLDFKAVQVVGEHIPNVIRGETTILEHLMQDNLLTNFYSNAMGFDVYTRYLARMVGQLTNRYPHMNIVEIGAGTGAATKGIFKEVGKTFNSYTYTDISTGFFETAQKFFRDYTDRMVFKVLDIEKDIASQGFVDHSFDLIVASWVIHATRGLEHTLRNLRRLLKPGGYLLMLEVTDNSPMKSSFIFGSLPGWWLGAEDGRVLSPCVSPPQWDSLLRKAGFSGIDAITPELDRLPFPASLIASQAIDDRINYLRHPLSASPASFRSEVAEYSLIILGGRTLNTSGLVADLIRYLGQHFGHTSCIDRLEDFCTIGEPSKTTVLSVTEMDEPVFKNLTTSSFDGLKKVFEKAKTVLWVTQGRRVDGPFANMTVGFGRTQLWEIPNLRLQFLDIDASQTPNAYLLAEALLRFNLASMWKKMLRKDLLWSVELELVLDKDEYFIPRLLANQKQNDRYNSSRRFITKDVDPRKCLVGIASSGASRVLQEEWQLGSMDYIDTASFFGLYTEYSLLSSVTVGHGGYLFLVLGKKIETGEAFLGLSETHTSIAMLRQKWSIPCYAPIGQETDLISSIASNLLSLCITQLLSSGETLLVHDPEPLFASVLARRAAEKSIQVFYTTISPDIEGPLWVKIHPRAPRRAIKMLLPENVSVFIDFSNSLGSKRVSSSIAACLPLKCKGKSATKLFGTASRVSPIHTEDSIYRLLQAALQHANEDLQTFDHDIRTSTVALAEFSREAEDVHPFSVVNWVAAPTIQVQVHPVDARPLFARDKTYWLVGLTRGLGLSLCEWMMRHGAKYIVLSSRNPGVDMGWLSKMKSLGTTIGCFANDVTNKTDLQILHKKICSTFPPIAGVAQGAMVLEDSLTCDMSLDTMMKVLRPKVVGSIHLDDLFSEDNLDFFIFLSSMASITGNIGQSNYSAANEFMSALAAQRRKRSLAASVINIGVILGAGYITREVGQQSDEVLSEGGHMRMSERDFHQIFAEAVLASHPKSGLDPEIFTGLRYISASEPNKPFWFDNPKFAHQILPEVVAVVGECDGKTRAPIKSLLLAATSREQLYDILKENFISKLQSTLQLTHNSFDKDLSFVHLRTDEMGIDSLIAVEIRTWFLKNLEVNMPVLKILGGASIGELLDHAMENLPESFKRNNSNIGDVSTNFQKPEAQPDLPIGQIYLPPSSTDGTSSQVEESSLEESKESSLLGSSEPGQPQIKSSGSSQYLERTEAMSFGQSMFWFQKIYLADQTTPNHTCCFHVNGALHVDNIEKALHAVAQRHEALRTCFFMDEMLNPIQGIMSFPILRLEKRWIRDEGDVAEEFSRIRDHVFDLEHGETMRVLLLLQSPVDYYLILGCHHINMDGISLQVFMSDLEKAYSGQNLNSTVLQYPDFSIRQREELRAGKWKKELLYWREEFRDIPSPLPLLPLSQRTSRRPLSAYSVHRVDFRIDSTVATQIQQTCRQCRATPFHFYLAVFRALLYRYLGFEDLCIGIGDGNRTEDSMMESIGPYVNLLPLRFNSQSVRIFSDMLEETRTRAYSALANSRVPFEVILNELNVPRSASHSPLFQTFVDYRQGARERQSFGDCELEISRFEAGRTAYDLSLDIVDNPGNDSLLMLMVQSNLYNFRDAEILMNSYVDLLVSFSCNPEISLDKPELFRRKDTEVAIDLGRGPIRESRWPETLIHRIESITQRHGEKPAVKDGEGTVLTYSQMAVRVNSIATTLSSAGIEPGSIIAVLQEPKSDWICSIFAIMRIGAVYLPLDLGTPLSRLAVIVSDCQPSAIVVDAENKQFSLDLKARDAEIINVSTIPSIRKVFVPIRSRSESPAVILYTSGSTGTPKGIILRHSNLRNEIEWSASIYKFNCENVLQQSAVSFDMSLTQIFTAAAFGGMLYVVPRSVRGDSRALTQIIAFEGISLTAATPSEYISWFSHGEFGLRQPSKWAIAISGGEQVTNVLLRGFRGLELPGLRLFNAYGPTEVTCSSNKMELPYATIDTSHERMPAGKASPNCFVYIVDKGLKPVPIGVRGEILVGGAGVASGYLDEELTREYFIPDICNVAEHIAHGWKTVYRTGDLGRWRDDGAILIEDRITGDSQIKLKGLRIELRDVENSILETSNGALTQAVVSARGINAWDPDFLVAHVVFSSDYLPGRREHFFKALRSDLPLPRYMHPAMIIPLDQMPVDRSSKLDRRAISALPLPQSPLRDENLNSLTESESTLKRIWEEVLPREIANYHAIDGESDFFHVGGNSMLLVNLQNLIHDTFEIFLPLVDLFESSTLSSMASNIENGANTIEMESIDWEHETEPFDLLQIPESSEAVMAVPPRVVVLTGATGFVGEGLLRHLLEDENIGKIYCIAVRGYQNLSRPLFNHTKVAVYIGNLEFSRLGLSEQEAVRIFREADVIIHNGADVGHLKTFQTLKRANLESTKELVKMCLPRRIPFHYISTAGVTLFSGKETFGETSTASYPPPTDGSDGYTASKWCSERYLEKVNESFHLPVSIHRPSSIVREQISELDIFQNLLKFSRLMNAVPESPNLRGTLDLVSLDTVVRDVVQELRPRPRSSPISYLNHTGDVQVPLSEMKPFLDKEYDINVTTLPMGEWAIRARPLGLHVALRAFFEKIESGGPIMFPRFTKNRVC